MVLLSLPLDKLYTLIRYIVCWKIKSEVEGSGVLTAFFTSSSVRGPPDGVADDIILESFNWIGRAYLILTRPQLTSFSFKASILIFNKNQCVSLSVSNVKSGNFSNVNETQLKT